MVVEKWPRNRSVLDTRNGRQRPIANRHEGSETRKRKPTNERNKVGTRKRDERKEQMQRTSKT